MAIYKALDKMKFDYTNVSASTPYQRINPTEIYLAKPGKRIIGNLNGIDEDSCHLEINFQNTSVLEFTVNRIVDGEISNHYDFISQHYELYAKGFGWFKINEEPQVDNDGSSETKSVRAESLEIELQQYDLVNFDINTGELWSKEMMAPDNTYTYVDDYVLQYDNVKFYRDVTDWDNLIAEFPDDGTEADLMNYVNSGHHNFLLDSWRFKLDLDEFEEGVNKVAEEYTKGGLKDAAKSVITRWEMSKTQGNAFNMLIAYPQIKQYVNYIGVDTTYLDENEEEQTATIKEILIRERNRFKALSFLDLVLEGTGWKPGYIDPNYNSQSEDPAEKEKLADRVGYFQVDSQDIYSFLTQDAAQYYRCIFDFDTENCTVNAYKVETIGKDTSIFLSFHNIQNSVTKSSDRQFHTVYHVANGSGDDSIDIRQANFGQDTIEDLSFFMNRKHFPIAFIDRYNEWVEYREGRRQEYMDLAVQYRDANDVMDEIYRRVPVDNADTNQYSSFTVTELEAERANCMAQLRGYQAMHVDDQNKFDEEDLMNSRDWGPYHMIDTVVLSTPHDTINVDDDSQEKTENALWTMNNDATIGNLINKLYDLKTQIDKDKDDLEQLEFEIDVLTNDTIPFLQTKVNEAQTAVNQDPNNQEKKDALKTAQQDLQNARDRLTAKQAKLSPLRQSISSKESEIRSKEPQIEMYYNSNKYEGILDDDTIETVLMYCKYDNRLGTIDTELFNRWLVKYKSIGDTIVKREFDDDYMYDFDMYGDAYGLKELETQLKSLEDKVETEKQYASKSGQSDEYHRKHKELYEKYLDAYNECKDAYNERKQQYDDAEAEVKRISAEMTAVSKAVDIKNFTDSKGTQFTQKDLDLLKKYYINTDYVNDNIVVTDMFTNKQIVDTEYDLIKDAYEELYADSHPQWNFQTTQDNLLLMPELQDWHGDLEIGNFIRVGFRDDDPYYIFCSSEDNQVKLRLITISFNPFMIEPTIDLTFSNMVQYKSKRNDFVEIIGTAAGKTGKNQISASYSSQSNATTNVTTDFIMQLLNNTTFKNGVAGNIAAGIIGGGVITDALNSMDLSVDQIADLTTRLSDLADGYLDANLIVTKILQADQASIGQLIARTVNADSVIAGLVDAQQGDFDQLTAQSAFVQKLQSDYIDANTIRSKLGQIDSLTSKFIVTDQLFAEGIEALSQYVVDSTVTSQHVVDLVANHLTVNQLAAGDLVLTDGMRIISNNENGGNVLFNGSTLQFLDAEGNVGIQIGYNTQQDAEHPHIIITDDQGSTILTSSGITSNAVADQLLVNRMFEDRTLEKEKINFPIFQPNEYGGTDVYVPHDPESGSWGNEYHSFINDYLGTSPYVELDKHLLTIYSEDGVINLDDPSQVTLTATTHFGAEIDSWEVTGYPNVPISVSSNNSYLIINANWLLNYPALRIRVRIKGDTTTSDSYDTAIVLTIDDEGNDYYSDTYTEYCLYDSSTTIDENEVTWQKEKPDPDRSSIDRIEDIANNFIWQRDVVEVGHLEEVDGEEVTEPIQKVVDNVYTFTPVCFVEQTNMQFIMDKAKRSIVSRLTDMATTTINENITRLTTRESYTEQTLDGIKNVVSRNDVDYITLPDGTQIQTVAKSVKTVADQTADTFSWIIEGYDPEDGSIDETSFTLTQRMANLVTGSFVITGEDGTSTVIEGGNLLNNSITTDMLTTDAIKSLNYQETNPESEFSLSGSYLDLENGNLKTPSFSSLIEYDNNGVARYNAYFKGNITTASGDLGGWKINGGGIYKDDGDTFVLFRSNLYRVITNDNCDNYITANGAKISIVDETITNESGTTTSSYISAMVTVASTAPVIIFSMADMGLMPNKEYTFVFTGSTYYQSIQEAIVLYDASNNQRQSIRSFAKTTGFIIDDVNINLDDYVEDGFTPVRFELSFVFTLKNYELGESYKILLSGSCDGVSLFTFSADEKYQSGNYPEALNEFDVNTVLGVRVTENNNSTIPFYLTKQGYLYAQNADITGNITATTGNIGGWSINEHMMRRILTKTVDDVDYTMEVRMQSTFYTEQNQNAYDPVFWVRYGAPNATEEERNVFYVRSNGEIKATKGRIGNWVIQPTHLGYGTWCQDNSAFLVPNGLVGTIGGTNISNLVITAGSKFGVTGTGDLYASSGNIGGWTIDSSWFKKTVTIDGVKYEPYLHAPNSPVLSNSFVGIQVTKNNVTSYPFHVLYDGTLHATGAVISGDITASSGSITGGLTVTGYLTTNANRVSYNSTSATGITIDKNGIGGYGSANAFFNLTTGGVLTAKGANITGAITATSITTPKFNVNNTGDVVINASSILDDTCFQVKCQDFTSNVYAQAITVTHADSSTNPPTVSQTTITSGQISTKSLIITGNASIAGTATFAGGSISAFVESSGNQRNVLSPNTNGDGVLGTDSFRWSYLYTTHAVDVSSDKKLKDHIEYLSEDVNLENFFDSLQPVMYTLKSSKTNRRHMGLYAQDVSKSANSTIGDLSMIKAFVISSDGKESDQKYDPSIPDSNLSWSLCYEELIAPIIAVVQKDRKRIKQLENELKELKEKMNYENTKY